MCLTVLIYVDKFNNNKLLVTKKKVIINFGSRNLISIEVVFYNCTGVYDFENICK